MQWKEFAFNDGLNVIYASKCISSTYTRQTLPRTYGKIISFGSTANCSSTVFIQYKGSVFKFGKYDNT